MRTKLCHKARLELWQAMDLLDIPAYKRNEILGTYWEWEEPKKVTVKFGYCLSDVFTQNLDSFAVLGERNLWNNGQNICMVEIKKMGEL